MGSGGTIVILLGVLAALVLWFRNEGRPYEALEAHPASPDDAILAAIRVYTMQGWQATTHAERNVSFVKTRRGGFLGSKSRAWTINVSANDRSGGGSVIDLVTNVPGRKGKYLADLFLERPAFS